MFEHQLKVYGNQFKCLEIQIRGTISQSKLSKSPWISHFSLKLKQKRSFPSVNMKRYINKSFLFFWASGLLCTQDLCESIVWRYRCFYRREKKAENCDLVSLGQKYISSDSLRKCSRRPKSQVLDNSKKVRKKRIKCLTIIRKWKKNQVVVNNKKVKKVKMAKVYTELKNMDACDDNYQVRQILIKFSYLKENFSGLFR